LWSEIQKHFIDYPAQLKVARLLFERGFQVSEDGEVVSGRIEIPHTQIAIEAEVQRRAVDSTVKTILSVPQLKRIYTNLRQICLLEEVAHELNLGAIAIIPKNARQKGLIAKVTQTISEQGLNILQAFAEHPDISPKPKLTIITEQQIPPELIIELRKLPEIESIIVY